MRIKADLYSGRLFGYWEPKKRDHQTGRPNEGMARKPESELAQEQNADIIAPLGET
jgi:hypothetical protein